MDTIKIKNIYNKYIKDYLWHILIIFISFILLLIAMNLYNDVFPIDVNGNFKYISTTLAVWTCIYLIFKGITNNSFTSILLTISIETVFDFINCIVRCARGGCISISDIFAIRTALSVAGKLNVSFNNKFFFAIILSIIIITMLVLFRKKLLTNKDKWQIRLSKFLIGILIIFIFTRTNIFNTFSLWDLNNTYRVIGTPLTILRMLHNFNVQPPAGYNKDEVKSLLESYEINNSNDNSDYSSNDELPNIIVIVNESFCDYYNLYKEGYADPIEYFNTLSKSENVISGRMYSSTFGGQTSNVEYEFLTQNSIKILPIGSYIFQQYITSPIRSSIVQNLKAQGYVTSAIHPWENFAYSRNKIYPFLGFDSIKFKNDIEGLESTFNNEFFTDKSTYRELLKELNEKKSDEKVFKYVLTVQNHIGYNNPDSNQMTYHDENPKNVYMQLIHDSASALEELIETLKSYDEKYILLFFGDHQPNLDNIDNFAHRDIISYELPFIIWANYDIEEQYDVKTSTVFIQNYLLKAAKVRFSAMNNYMEDLQKSYPVITMRYFMDNNGTVYKNDDTSLDEHPKLKEYEKIDYYRVFDNK